MASPTQPPNFQGPRLPSEENRESEIDPEKFRRAIKVEETDDSQKKKKRQPAEEESEEEAEAESASQAGAAAAGFSSFMSEDEKGASILDVGKTGGVRRAPSANVEEETKMWEGPRSSYAGRIMGKDTGEEVSDALFEGLKAPPSEGGSPTSIEGEKAPTLSLGDAPPSLMGAEEAEEPPSPPQEPPPEVAAAAPPPPPPAAPALPEDTSEEPAPTIAQGDVTEGAVTNIPQSAPEISEGEEGATEVAPLQQQPGQAAEIPSSGTEKTEKEKKKEAMQALTGEKASLKEQKEAPVTLKKPEETEAAVSFKTRQEEKEGSLKEGAAKEPLKASLAASSKPAESSPQERAATLPVALTLDGHPLVLSPEQKIPDGFTLLLQKKEQGTLTPKEQEALSQMQVAMGFEPLASIALSPSLEREASGETLSAGKISVKAPDAPVIYTESGTVLTHLLKEETGERDSHSHKEQEENVIAPITPPLTGMFTPTVNPAEQPAYTKLPPDFYELFEKMVGIMTVETTKGVSTTTVKLDMPGSVFDKAEIILERYETAPNTFNLQLQGSEKAVNLFNANITELAAAFQGARLSFDVNIRRPILLKKEEEEGSLFQRKSTDYNEQEKPED